MLEIIAQKAMLGPALIASIDPKAKRVGVKVHFGRTSKPGSHVDPAIFSGLMEAARKQGAVLEFFDTNTLYGGERRYTKSHLDIARRHGFSPARILDEADLVELGPHISIPQQIENYDQIFNVAHFTGHKVVGIGGCIKNIGMGMVARATKLWVHNGGKPKFYPDKCVRCGWCVRNCEHLSPGGPDAGCTACAACVGNCKAIGFSFGRQKEVARRLVIAAEAVAARFRMVHVAVAANPTRLCDCMGDKRDEIMAKGFWAVIGDDPAEVDRAMVQHFAWGISKYYDLALIGGQLNFYRRLKERRAQDGDTENTDKSN